MKSFTSEFLSSSVPMGLLWLSGAVMESKGRQELFEHQKPELLRTLRQVAMIQSVESSNRIEGVTVEHSRLKPLVMGKVTPRDRSEEEIVGYRKALSWIHESHDSIVFSSDTLKELHQLAQGGFSGDAGEYKQKNNDIIELFPDGRRQVRFQTVSVEETPDQIEQLCLAYHHVMDQGLLPPLIAIASVVFDFLCIHPFRDGNGRVARLLVLLLLYHHDFRVGRYISLERIVEETKEGYYDTLGQSSQGWHEGQHDLTPWWSYFLSTIKQAYRKFEERVQQISTQPTSKTEMVRLVIETLPHEFTMAQVQDLCPDTSRELIRKVLRELRDAGSLATTGRGRGAKWKKGGTNS